MKKIKHAIATTLFLALAAVSTGCGMITQFGTTVKSNGKVSIKATVGYDEEFIKKMAEASDSTPKQVIKDMEKDGTKFTKKVIDGTTFYVTSAQNKGLTMAQAEKQLEEDGFSNVCITKDYFYAGSAAMDGKSAYKNLGSDDTTNYDSETEEALEGMDLYISFEITLPSKVKTSNGTIKSKTVTWSNKQMSKLKYLYASTTKVTKTAKTTSVKNKQTVKAGKTIKVSNYKSAAKVTLDDKTVKNSFKVNKKGKHVLKIWSKNGKIQVINFKVK